VDLEGRVAVVTGGSGTLGGATARAFAAEGATVAVTYVGEQAHAEEIAASLSAGPAGASSAFRLDQSDPESVEAFVAEVVARYGRLDILINNAAWNFLVPFPDLEALTVELWDRIHTTNLRGPFLLARAAAPALRAAQGRIVNVASIAGNSPGGSSIAYATSKAGLMHLTRCLAVALAPDVAVNCVAPGMVPGSRMAARYPASVLESIPARALLGRAATAEDMAEQILAFCRSDSMTGQIVAVDGGQSGAR
jgi:3-oxoacyl-[acyl-carrier protein] reductase